jgi:hypothetical protein
MALRTLLVTIMLLGSAGAAEARVLEMDTARYNDTIAAFYKMGGYRVLNRAARAQWAWHSPSLGAARDLALKKRRFVDGDGWAFSYTAGGQSRLIRFAAPGFDRLGQIDAVFVGTDLQAIVVFATEAVRPNHQMLTYRARPDARGQTRFVLER